ncbi:hypothetical protein F383_35445 [Gossypium arboreum]|uniref:Uncharacterized protein n=1 Tax=Gossypium arboreum TaxID=29729 RepID=A0A0B0N6L9_GOSAR|nr:hypothetical protein F383_35445 [Gossypium arboreum]
MLMKSMNFINLDQEKCDSGLHQGKNKVYGG